MFSQQCRFRTRVQQIIDSLDVTITFLPRETECVSLLRAGHGRANISYFPGGDVRWIERDHSVVKLVNPSVAIRKAEELQEFHIDAVLSSGVPEAWFESVNSVRQLQGGSHPILLFVGRLESNKGVTDLIPILAGIVPRYPNVELRIVGDGPLLEALRRQAASAGIEQCITFTGAVSHERVLAEMRSADLLVFPTRHENLPLTLLEAQAAGLPFVASDIPGIQGYVHEQACLLPVGNIDAWIRTIDELVAGQETRRTISSAGREWARAHTWERVTDEMEKYIDLALSRAGNKLSH
jgi:glycosyltransferase involved in cell wall biosynthesis